MEGFRFQSTDPDFRRTPKTKLFCALCQRDIKPGAEKYAFIFDMSMTVMHPVDVQAAQAEMPADSLYGWLPVGPECAKKLGAGWTLNNIPDNPTE